MYETVIIVDNKHLRWLDELASLINEKLGDSAVTACKIGGRCSYISVGADGRRTGQVAAGVASSLISLILGRMKYDFISERIRSLRCPDASIKLLCHALTGFDRETEEEMVAETLPSGKILDLEGYRNFRMSELVSRWMEICRLATEHSAYLCDEETMNELLRFLIDAGRSDGSRAEIFKLGGKYRIVEHRRDGESGEKIFETFDDMLCHLIDIAPCETVVSGFEYDDKFRRLHSIFDVKCNNLR